MLDPKYHILYNFLQKKNLAKSHLVKKHPVLVDYSLLTNS